MAIIRTLIIHYYFIMITISGKVMVLPAVTGFNQSGKYTVKKAKLDDNRSAYTKLPLYIVKPGTRLRYLESWSFSFENYLTVDIIMVIR